MQHSVHQVNKETQAQQRIADEMYFGVDEADLKGYRISCYFTYQLATGRTTRQQTSVVTTSQPQGMLQSPKRAMNQSLQLLV